jgi:hypothetical protein
MWGKIWPGGVKSCLGAELKESHIAPRVHVSSAAAACPDEAACRSDLGFRARTVRPAAWAKSRWPPKTWRWLMATRSARMWLKAIELALAGDTTALFSCEMIEIRAMPAEATPWRRLPAVHGNSPAPHHYSMHCECLV